MSMKDFLSKGLGDLETFAIERDPRPSVHELLKEKFLLFIILMSVILGAVILFITHGVILWVWSNLPQDIIQWAISLLITVDFLLTALHWGEG